jgi:hypothetical protein
MATASKNTVKPVNTVAKRVTAVKGPAIKKATVETMNLVDQQNEMTKKTAGKIVMPAVKIAEPAPMTKADIARRLYGEMKATNTRQEILLAFQTVAMLTPAGSATYYANLRKQK